MSEQLKEYRKNYYKTYYQKNIEYYTKKNRERPSRRNNYVGIEINGITYCFPSKASISWKKIHKNDIDNSNILLAT